MKLYICANGYTETQINEALRVVGILKNLNHECSVHEHPDVNDFTAEDSDLIVSLGGDGALLNAGKIALKADKPLLGINAGRVGHLCAIGIGDIDNFNDIFKNCEIQYRSILHYAFDDKQGVAINDVTVGKNDFGKTVDLTVLVNGKEIGKLRGDGLIISTPTGSSAYNVAAGGSLIDYDAKVLAITPICPHNSTLLPNVIADDKAIEVIVNHDDGEIHEDGVFVGKTSNNIIIKKDIKPLELYVKK